MNVIYEFKEGKKSSIGGPEWHVYCPWKQMVKEMAGLPADQFVKEKTEPAKTVKSAWLRRRFRACFSVIVSLAFEGDSATVRSWNNLSQGC